MQVPILTPADFVTQLGEESSTQDVIQWSLERFADQKMVLSTGFGMEGCALIEMYAAHQKPLDIILGRGQLRQRAQRSRAQRRFESVRHRQGLGHRVPVGRPRWDCPIAPIRDANSFQIGDSTCQTIYARG